MTAIVFESFDTADSDTLGPELKWTETANDIDIVSNKAQLAGTAGVTSIARCENSIGTADMYVQADVTTNGTTATALGLQTRVVGTLDYYQHTVHWINDFFNVAKLVGGAFTEFATGGGPISPTNGTLRGTIQGSNPATIKTLWNGVEKVSTSDSDLDNGTLTAMALYRNAAEIVTLDNFEAGDFNDAQLLAAAQDISAGPWLPSSGSPAELWEMIDGIDSPDTDYDYTLSAGAMEVRFSTGNVPLSEGGLIRYRLMGFNGTTDALIKLKQGETVLAQWTESNVPAGENIYVHSLISSPSIVITDASDLRLSVEAV